MCKSPWDAITPNQLAFNVTGNTVEDDNKYCVNQDTSLLLDYNAIAYESGVFTVEKRNCWYTNIGFGLQYYLKVHTSTPSQRFTTSNGKYNGTVGTNGYAS